MLSRLTSIVLHTDRQYFATSSDAEGASRDVFDGLGMPKWTQGLRIREKFSHSLQLHETQRQTEFLASKKLATEYDWNNLLDVGIEWQASEMRVCLSVIRQGWRPNIEIAHRRHAKVSTQLSLYRRGT